jgi:ubiquinone biosynthesis protein UbiJ
MTKTVSLRKVPTTKIMSELARRKKKVALLRRKRNALNKRLEKLNKKISSLGGA